MTLFYGSPVPPEGRRSPEEQGVGDLQYELDRFPDLGHFLDGALQVGVCFERDVPVPHLDDDPTLPTLEPMLQREGVLLERRGPAFCDGSSSPAVLSASIGEGVAMAVKRLAAVFRRAEVRDDRLVRGLGGSALDFSRFLPVAAGTQGTLEFLSFPPSVAVEGVALGEIRVRARSAAGTPIEKVQVTLSLTNNRGIPAGAVLYGDTESLTLEAAGAEGVAVFPDDAEELTVGKPGGYVLCAEGVLDGFTFPRTCTPRFHVRNAR